MHVHVHMYMVTEETNLHVKAVLRKGIYMYMLLDTQCWRKLSCSHSRIIYGCSCTCTCCKLIRLLN